MFGNWISATAPRYAGGDWTSRCSRGFSQYKILSWYHVLSAAWKSVHFWRKSTSTLPGHPGGENLWAVASRLIVEEKIRNFRLLLKQFYIWINIFLATVNKKIIWAQKCPGSGAKNHIIYWEHHWCRNQIYGKIFYNNIKRNQAPYYRFSKCS